MGSLGAIAISLYDFQNLPHTLAIPHKEAVRMKHVVRLTLVVVSLSLLLLTAAAAQDQYTEGTVNRVVLLRILPGHFNAAMDDLKKNVQPVWEAEKANGLIENYQLFLNQTKSSPNDWDIGLVLTYKNMASLDGLGMKVLELRMKQYGDKNKEQQVVEKRVENLETVASYLTRNIMLK